MFRKFYWGLLAVGRNFAQQSTRSWTALKPSGQPTGRQHILQQAGPPHKLRVGPDLVEGVELEVGEERRRGEHEGQRQEERPRAGFCLPTAGEGGGGADADTDGVPG